MINFFRNIRRQLANENKFQRYFRYAFGEVVLIMLGIFMALQLQNWNEKRKQVQNFNTILEQIYNALHYDSQHFDNSYKRYSEQIVNLNSLLKQPDSVPLSMLPYQLFNVSFTDINDYTSNVSFHIENLSFSDDNIEQNEIFKQITNYVKQINVKIEFNKNDISNLFDELNLLWPEFNYDDQTDGIILNDSTYYLNSDLTKLDKFRHSARYTALLSKLKFANVIYKYNSYSRHKYAQSLIQQIKTYYPKVKLLFTNVGIIGTSLDGFDDLGGTSTAMTLIDGENDIWEATLFLKHGEVKFRCNDSWFQNWGAKEFPNGTGLQEGPNIPIPEASTYHIIFKPVTGEYQFIKNHEPPNKLVFQDVGIKGTSIDGLDNADGKSTAMKLTNEQNNIWEIDIFLFKGSIKFRCQDSWVQNWGNSDFPKGKGYHDGPDIPIPEEGNYHIIFKPVTGEYEFIKQDDQP